MTQVASRPDDRVETSEAVCPTIWGLSARDIHDAFWRARGVQCVRRGEKAPLSKAADLFLLIEPRQLMLFDLAKLADRLIWRRATVTRLRILDQEAEPYTEQVVADTDGWVERIERRYVPRTRAAYRVFITSNRVIASRWAVATDRRETWKGIRRSVGRSRLDYCRYPGGCFLEGDHGQERDLIDRLVALWSDPGQAIEGIEQVGRGIWAAAGAAVEHLSEDVILVRPIWFGYGRARCGPQDGIDLRGRQARLRHHRKRGHSGPVASPLRSGRPDDPDRGWASHLLRTPAPVARRYAVSLLEVPHDEAGLGAACRGAVGEEHL
jgi:hypothetical protein